jgi:hypothetical protein
MNLSKHLNFDSFVVNGEEYIDVMDKALDTMQHDDKIFSTTIGNDIELLILFSSLIKKDNYASQLDSFLIHLPLESNFEIKEETRVVSSKDFDNKIDTFIMMNSLNRNKNIWDDRKPAWNHLTYKLDLYKDDILNYMFKMKTINDFNTANQYIKTIRLYKSAIKYI